MKYEEQLKDERWIKLRDAVKERDKVCQICGSDQNLHVHHMIYFKGHLAWEYDHQYLILLCSNCHIKEHKYRNTIKQRLAEMAASGLMSWEIYEVLFNK